MKSGFPLELFAREEILRSGLSLSSTKQFLNEDNFKNEIDIEASYQVLDNSFKPTAHLTTTFLVECKKNDSSPWVFFSDEFSSIGSNLVFRSQGKAAEISLHRLSPLPKHLHVVSKTAASIYVLPFKSEDSKEGRQIYDAIAKLISCYRFYSRPWPQSRHRRSHWATYFHLVVLFEGNLLLAHLHENKLSLKPVRYVLVNHIEPGPLHYSNFAIDVVRKDYLKTFLSKTKASHLILNDWIKRHGIPKDVTESISTQPRHAKNAR